ncbi:MAG: PD-(D/E)XK nuclease family protein, partial [Candidatus Margulisbacteria bacterium]|nr:PD-(D/E)XK nuclease family protein [Candidatus Margulisiibacteriota bacterium]
LQKLNHFSVTQLEKYSRCAFRFFCEDVLKLRGRPEDKTNLTIGSLMHKVLELSYLDQQTDLDKLVEDIWNSTEFKGKLKLLHGQAEAERKKISFILKRFIEQDKLVSAERNFWPAEYEKKMSARDCAVYKLGGNTLSGTIDRVDKNAAEDFLIIDYKSGQLPQLEPAELEKGILPQALVYALIYRELSGLSPAGAEYCGLKKNKRSGLYSAKYQNLIRSKKFVTPAEFTKILNNLRSKLAEYFAAIQRGEFWQNNEEKCPEYCTASEICRQKQTGAPI